MGKARCTKARNIKYNMRNTAGATNDDNDEDVQDATSDDESTCRGKREFTSATEQKLVDFFSENECFYNKGSPQFANTKYKRRLVENLARELETTGN